MPVYLLKALVKWDFKKRAMKSIFDLYKATSLLLLHITSPETRDDVRNLLKNKKKPRIAGKGGGSGVG